MSGLDLIEVSTEKAEEIREKIKLYDNAIEALRELSESKKTGLSTKVFKIVDAELDALVGYVLM